MSLFKRDCLLWFTKNVNNLTGVLGTNSIFNFMLNTWGERSLEAMIGKKIPKW
jgi:hypothetical protein